MPSTYGEAIPQPRIGKRSRNKCGPEVHAGLQQIIVEIVIVRMQRLPIGPVDPIAHQEETPGNSSAEMREVFRETHGRPV